MNEVNVPTAAALLAVSPATVRRLIRAGVFTARDAAPPTSHRHMWRLLTAEIEAYKENGRALSSAAANRAGGYSVN